MMMISSESLNSNPGKCCIILHWKSVDLVRTSSARLLDFTEPESSCDSQFSGAGLPKDVE